ncbi:MAG TPA: hypothetical protein VGO97_00535 [Solirubrobacterales bacterium]|nr:hypothetical protein [Solirubrobacterales bacterium]
MTACACAAALLLTVAASATAAEPDTARAAILNTMKFKTGQFAGSVAALTPTGAPVIDIKVKMLYDVRRKNDIRVSASYSSTTGPGDVVFTVARNKLYARLLAERNTYVVPLKSIGLIAPPPNIPEASRGPLADAVINQLSNWRTDSPDAVTGAAVTVYSADVLLDKIVTTIVPMFGLIPPDRGLILPGLDKVTVAYVQSIITGGVPARLQLGVDAGNLVRLFGVQAPLTYPGGQGQLSGRFEFTRFGENIKIKAPSKRSQKRAIKVTRKRMNRILMSED